MLEDAYRLRYRFIFLEKINLECLKEKREPPIP
jgi:hypothetical protein